MLFTEGVRLLQKSILNTTLAKYFLFLVLVKPICAKNSFEGYVEAYHAESDDNYKDAFEVVSDISAVNKNHEKKGFVYKKNDLGHKKKDLSHVEKDLGQDYDDDYEYKDEPHNEAGHLDPEVEHVIGAGDVGLLLLPLICKTCIFYCHSFVRLACADGKTFNLPQHWERGSLAGWKVKQMSFLGR